MVIASLDVTLAELTFLKKCNKDVLRRRDYGTYCSYRR
jgi:hypothetical protein